MNTSLTLTKLKAGYHGKTVLHDVTMPQVEEGSVIGLLGANAAGKSTLLKAIAGLIHSSGEIRFGDRDLATVGVEERRRLIGYLPQTLPLSTGILAYELVLSAQKASAALVGRADDASAIEAVFDDLGLGEFAFRPVSELSGGKRQLVGLAQVIVRDPQLLLLDEPISALDLRWQLEVLERVRTRVKANGRLALVALHDLNLAMRFCDQVMVLGQGRRLAFGPPAEVLTPELLRDAWQVDARVEHCSNDNPLVIVDRAAVE